MENKTYYQKVSVKERLPKKSDYYFTDRGYIIFGTNTGKFQESEEYYPKYWLEEASLPASKLDVEGLVKWIDSEIIKVCTDVEDTVINNTLLSVKNFVLNPNQ